MSLLKRLIKAILDDPAPPHQVRCDHPWKDIHWCLTSTGEFVEVSCLECGAKWEEPTINHIHYIKNLLRLIELRNK